MFRFYYFLFLLISSSLLGGVAKIEENNSLPLADTETSSSTIVAGCINVLTGTYVAPQQDWTILSAEPLSLMRMYTHKKYFKSGLHSCWKHNFNSIADLKYHKVTSNQKNKCQWSSTVISPIGNATLYYSETPGHKRPDRPLISFRKHAFNLCGLTNNGSDLISGQTNLKNQYCEFDRKNKRLIVTNGAGLQYILKQTDHEEMEGLDAIQNGNEWFKFTIAQEKRPSGNLVHYQYDSHGNLAEVKCTNALGTVLFGSFQFETLSRSDFDKTHSLSITGNDGRKVKYRFLKKSMPNKKEAEKEKQYFIKSVETPEQPKLEYEYTFNYDESAYLLSSLKNPQGRFLNFEYYQEGEPFLLDRIKSVKMPSGDGTGEELLYTLSYHVPNAHEFYTEVRDAHNHKTQYFYNHEPRLKKIDRFVGTGHHALYSSEEFHWGEETQFGNLLSHTLKDSAQNILCCRCYHYDARGNVLKEQVWGNLTGKGSPSIHLQNAYPIANGAECYSVERHYSDDGFNLLQKEIFPNGKIIEYLYKPGTNLLTAKYVTSREGLRIREFLTYDDNALLIKKIIDNGTGVDLQDLTNVSQRLITYTTPNLTGGGIGLPAEISEYYWDQGAERLLNRSVFNYDSFGHLERKELYDSRNVLQFWSEWSYNTKGHLKRETNAANQTVEYDYDENGNRISTTGPHPQVTIKDTYDCANRLIQSEEIHPTQSFTRTYQYDVDSKLRRSIDIFGNETHYDYDDLGRLIQTQFPAVLDENGTQYSPIEHYGYDTFGNKTSHTDSKGYTTLTTYTLWGKPAHIQYPDGTQERFEYTLEGHLAKKVEKNGTVVLYTYDGLGRKVLQETYSNSQLLCQESWTYDAFNLLSHNDANGNVTLYTYDGAGRKTSESHLCTKGNTLTSYEYDTLGRLNKTIQAYGDHPEESVVHIQEFDILDQLVEERTESAIGELLSKTEYRYDIVGNCIETISYQQPTIPLSTKTTFDLHNNPIDVTDPLGNVTHYEYNYHFINPYNICVLQKTITAPNGIQTIETYDSKGKIVSSFKRNAFGVLLSKEEIRYDRNGNAAQWIESAIVNGEEKQRIINSKEFGVGNRLECLIEALGTPEQKITRYSYNEYGQQDRIIKPNGMILHSVYDPRRRLESYFDSENTISYKYEYDHNHNLTHIEDRIHGTHTFRTYDSLNRVTEETLGNGLRFAFEYDRLGRKTNITFPDTTAIKYIHDASNLKEVVRLDTSGLPRYTHSYDAHNLFGEVTHLKYAHRAGEENRTFDALGRRMSTHSEFWCEEVPENGYDSVGNLLTSTVREGTQYQSNHYSYDDLNQLIKEEGSYHHQFAYDSLNNCLEKDGVFSTHNALNQILSTGSNTFRYSINGNLIENKTEEQTTHYEYDALDRLTSMTQEGFKVCYTYDHFHRRLKKQYFSKRSDGTWATGYEQLFLYVEQDEIGSCDKNGDLIELRVLGVGLGAEIGSTIAVEKRSRVFVPVHNMRGDICCVIDADTQKVVQSFHYSAYGEQNTKSILSWGFSSKRYDPETGFIYFGRRYYAPFIGRWITADPLGYADGPNLYAYVHNNPLTHFDLYGLYGQYNYGIYSPSFYSKLDSMSGSNNFTRNVVSNYSMWDRFKDYGGGLGKGFFDPLGTIAGYGKSLYNYDFRNTSYSQMFRDTKLTFSNPEFLGTLSGAAMNLIPFNRAVSVGAQSFARATNFGKQIISNNVYNAAANASRGFVQRQVTHQAYSRSVQVAEKGLNKSYSRVFPKNPSDLLKDLPRDARGHIYPCDNLRIRPERHLIKNNEIYSPRHHEQHYHVDVRIDPQKGWNKKGNTYKLKPPNYQQGEGTGFLPEELFPGV